MVNAYRAASTEALTLPSGILENNHNLPFVPPHRIRPALLGDVKPPGLLLPVSKFGAPFLVCGDVADPIAMFLGGQHRFLSFKRANNEDWGGLAIEGIEFELNIGSAVDLVEHTKSPGMMVRHGIELSLAAIEEGPFKRVVDVPVIGSLATATLNQSVGFKAWRIIVRTGDERFVLWWHSPDKPDDH